MTEKPLARRIADRGFPSVFQAWSPADEPKGVPIEPMLARHDLIFHGTEFFGLKWNRKPIREARWLTVPLEAEELSAMKDQIVPG